MLKKLSTIGSSKGLILDKTLLGLLGIEDGEEVSLRVEGRRLIVEAPTPLAEIRARVVDDLPGRVLDAKVDAATKRERSETVRKLKASRTRQTKKR
jgi:antitoxin component of MazEF toxin-antitoxin module